jgi:indole-3-glycerol phosphate synthase
MNRSASGEGGSILDRVVATKRTEIGVLSERRSELRRQAERAPGARPFAAALTVHGEVALIAEYKRRSPSAGAIGGGELEAVVGGYEAGGAAALSVLTDCEYFGGSMADLTAAKAAVLLPVLRKDFVLDDVQVWESRAGGADAILLIVRILGDEALRGLMELSSELGMAAVVEVHDGDELERALKAGASLVGVNNRDLQTFRTDLAVSEELVGRIPADRVAIAESGIGGGADVERLGRAGFDAVLVGEALMRAGGAGEVRGFSGRAKRDRNGSSALWRASTC